MIEITAEQFPCTEPSTQQPGETMSALEQRWAIQQFLKRRSVCSQIKRIENSQAYAGEPMIFYCQHCGILSDILPEDFLFPPRQTCSQCQGLIGLGILDEAKSP